tara:strand:- start:212 stop:406 length:195 start_codon:yes stop_codon:yes gene_type:complete
MAKIRLFQAIESLNPNAKYKYLHDSKDESIELIDTIIWEDGTTPISNADILAEQTRLQDIEDNK